MSSPKQIWAATEAETLKRHFEAAAPPERRFSQRELVDYLAPEIKAKRRQGWRWEEIRQALSQHGFTVAASTLRRHANETKKNRRGTKPIAAAALVNDPKPAAVEPATRPAPVPRLHRTLAETLEDV